VSGPADVLVKVQVNGKLDDYAEDDSDEDRLLVALWRDLATPAQRAAPA
jgi:hypothetical protein